LDAKIKAKLPIKAAMNFKADPKPVVVAGYFIF
jgi:hypothetical protein